MKFGSMQKRHIAIIVESSYGHLISVLGLAIGLIRRGHLVSCAVSGRFSAGIRAIGAKPITYTPSMSKMTLDDNQISTPTTIKTSARDLTAW
jgi:UDP:flavonoid glycosyltransferase YjiC (YdhE family)